MSKTTLDQERARHAWDAVQEAKKAKKDKDHDPKKYGGQAKKLPIRIIASGLGSALAFLKGKGYAPELVKDLSGWIAKQMPPTSKGTSNGESDDLLGRIIHGDSDFLRWATDETLAYLQWLNRFAEAEGLTDDENGN